MNPRVDIKELTRSVFNRLLSDAQGQQVRALLGSSQGCVIHARQMPRKRDDITLPMPFVAMRRGGLTMVEDVIHAVTFRWWVYDASDEDYFAISEIIEPICRAYEPTANPLYYPNGQRVGYVTADAGEEAEDTVLGMPYVIVTIVVYC